MVKTVTSKIYGDIFGINLFKVGISGSLPIILFVYYFCLSIILSIIFDFIAVVSSAERDIGEGEMLHVLMIYCNVINSYI